MAQRYRLTGAALQRLDQLTPLLAPVSELVAQDRARKAVVVPTGLLGILPLHAVPCPPSHALLDDAGTVIVAPSAAVLAPSRAKAARTLPELRLVGIADPTIGARTGQQRQVRPSAWC
ncbi:CHAT domain-containing protein [Streptacidiphilus jiangxiensis]|uniref:CHAT domain-containing protein n=1 Tax=Streptacidiphilus jiangxiensis TaxID=235985 RepID=A0A1H7VW88_STRJI|nr:CHAT domain-containing protein [Streptacidiphilus jiangxiensis]SEM13139.1 CHAT domain-containing protein [Streptacidiphilus jiangxiensis]